jgi:exodeoxyribonuclease III
MRLVTWNCCRGAHAKKAPLLDTLAPDIAVIQECAKPAVESSNCLWFGDNPRQGIAVQASESYRLDALPVLQDVPKYLIPVSVVGPTNFTLFAVWTHGKQPFRYVEAAVKAVDMYRDLIGDKPTVLMGDLNSNAIWDAEHPPKLNHSALVKQLAGLGLVSAYHHSQNEVHGRETLPTYYFQWNKDRPFHIDYCFVPKAWAKRILRVEIGSYEDWRQYSDHRPLLVEVADKPRRGGRGSCHL